MATVRPLLFFGMILMQASVETLLSVQHCFANKKKRRFFLLSGVDNASGQRFDYATRGRNSAEFITACLGDLLQHMRAMLICVCVCVSSVDLCGRQAADGDPGDGAALGTCAHR